LIDFNDQNFRSLSWTYLLATTKISILGDELTHFLSFVRRYPFVENEIVMISISSAIGQVDFELIVF
jgi:hypothetical protein